MLLSIITINFNNKTGLQKTINSVLSQKSNDFEYIVIDGGSTDGSIEVIEDIKDSLNYWVSEKDNGIYHAMNKGIVRASGKYLLFLNSGDLLFNDTVTMQLSEKMQDAAIYYSDALYIYSSTNKGMIKHFPTEITLDYLLLNSLNHQNCVIKKELFDKYGKYDETYKIASFRDFMLNLIKNQQLFVQLHKMIISIYDLEGISSNYKLSEAEWQQVVKVKHTALYTKFEQLLTKRKSWTSHGIAKIKRILLPYKLRNLEKLITMSSI